MRTPLAAVVLTTALLAVGCSGEDDPTVPVPSSSATGPAASTAATPGPTRPAGVDLVVEVEVRDGAVVGGARRVKVARGSVVELVVRSDVADEVHLHTYDKKVDVPAGGEAGLRFTASITGVIECELENAGLTLLRFQVQ